ncbi:mannose-6-phosphate isomerase, type 1 [Altererythrobacter xiamenensis]|uniref:Mannose-6-phosphate isomerase, type 1 n=1 Tax=Altererythrobacter xiamenensis TaxID=1316679 RepID=A0A1Y6ETI8_9SPHN|nr:class I mannose-6-phosphate isomerase [Altererythrobacter xiamenensis]SMQ63832.1 mannose-6-phosphate isomerase, type 1 [Altererythrobacter xiamenensis]
MTAAILPRHFVEKPWGQAGLPAHFGGREEKVGEIWFDRPEEPLPLLCKWLFTSEKLSVQVHPSDEQAQARGLASGKEECWIVTATEGDARLGIGLTQQLSDEELREASLSGAIEDMLDWKTVAPGDWYYIPAGTIHAIGAGVQLVEIQQNADITYRLYDYGRPRELHLDDGVAVSRPAPYSGNCGTSPTSPGLHRLVASPYFTIDRVIGEVDLSRQPEGDCYCIPVAGEFEISGQIFEPGEVALCPVSEIQPKSGSCDLLIAQAV